MTSFWHAGGNCDPHALAQRLVPTAENDVVTIDLSGSTWTSPHVLSLVPVLVENANKPLRFIPPEGSCKSYAARMHLGDVLTKLGIPNDLTRGNENDRADSLVALTSFSGTDFAGAENLCRLMSSRCDLAGVPAEVSDAISGHVYELCNNAIAHARCEQAWVCAQTYQHPGRTRLELTVADAGRGIRASLDGTEFAASDDVEAIRTAVERRSTSVGRPNHYGVGLTEVVRYATRMGGSATVRTGSASVQFTSSGAVLPATTAELQGTTVGCSIWF